jgi:hypothetical protein
VDVAKTRSPKKLSPGLRAASEFLSCAASIAIETDRLVQRLVEHGFSAFMPYVDHVRQQSEVERRIRCELRKEAIGFREIVVNKSRVALGYESAFLTELCTSAGIDRFSEQFNNSAADFLPLISEYAAQAQAFGKSHEELLQRTVISPAQRAVATEVRAIDLTELSSGTATSNRIEELALRTFKGFRLIEARNSRSSRVLVRDPYATPQMQVIVPRPGPAMLEGLPLDVPMVVRPWFDRDTIRAICGTAEDFLGAYDFRVCVSLPHFVPGFVIYRRQESWAELARAMQAFAALYEAVEDQLNDCMLRAAEVARSI